MNSDTDNPQAVDASIRQRKTTKVLSAENLPLNDVSSVVQELLEIAGWAPFHRPCDAAHWAANPLNGIVPWRMVVLGAAACRKLREQLPKENAGKLPAMLAAADALIQTTWLPTPAAADFQPTEARPFEPTLVNMEHIAAASAAIQNLLVAAAARGIRNYWSSGGVLLRTPEIFALLGIPPQEILLGSIFLFPSDAGEAQVVGSKLREQRPDVSQWSRWESL